MGTPSLITVKTQEELTAAVAKTKGPVVLAFTASWCEACNAQKPDLMKLAACTTVIQVDVDEGAKLADAWKVNAMPTLFQAKRGALLVPGKAKEVPDAKTALVRFKCAR